LISVASVTAAPVAVPAVKDVVGVIGLPPIFVVGVVGPAEVQRISPPPFFLAGLVMDDSRTDGPDQDDCPCVHVMTIRPARYLSTKKCAA
jgi:hypothetical protein